MKIRNILAYLLLAYATGISAYDEVAVNLNGNDWKLSYWEQPAIAVTSPDAMKHMSMNAIPATVPGNVEIDLYKAGLIKDPMVGNGTDELRQWEGTQWCYTKKFSAPRLEGDNRYELHFGGIDCFADIWLNGKHMGSTENMLIEHGFDVTDDIRQDADNTLQVITRSTVIEGQKHLIGQYAMGQFACDESVWTRKAPHMYGWDIMPRLVSAGLWKDVELRIVKPARIRDVNYVTTNVDPSGPRAWKHANVQVT